MINTKSDMQNFLSDLSLTFDVLDTRRVMCFYLATGRSVEDATKATDDWIAEMSKEKINVYHGLLKKSWEKE